MTSTGSSAGENCFPTAVEYEKMHVGLEAHNYAPAFSYFTKLRNCYLKSPNHEWATKQAAYAEYKIGELYIMTDNYPAAIGSFGMAHLLDEKNSQYRIRLAAAKEMLHGPH